jgi:hypothetical protein
MLDQSEPAVVLVNAATRHNNSICPVRLLSHLSYGGGYLDLLVGVSCGVRDSSILYWEGYEPLNA